VLGPLAKLAMPKGTFQPAAVFDVRIRAENRSLTFIVVVLYPEIPTVFLFFFTGKIWRCAFIVAVFLASIAVRGLGEWIF
jgi:hypothetical protein